MVENISIGTPRGRSLVLGAAGGAGLVTALITASFLGGGNPIQLITTPGKWWIFNILAFLAAPYFIWTTVLPAVRYLRAEPILQATNGMLVFRGGENFRVSLSSIVSVQLEDYRFLFFSNKFVKIEMIGGKTFRIPVFMFRESPYRLVELVRERVATSAG